MIAVESARELAGYLNAGCLLPELIAAVGLWHQQKNPSEPASKTSVEGDAIDGVFTAGFDVMFDGVFDVVLPVVVDVVLDVVLVETFDTATVTAFDAATVADLDGVGAGASVLMKDF